MRPEDIKNRTFSKEMRGYDKDEVRSFLFKVSESARELHEKLAGTEARLEAAIAVDENDDDFGENWAPRQDNAVPAALMGAATVDAPSLDDPALDAVVPDSLAPDSAAPDSVSVDDVEAFSDETFTAEADTETFDAAGVAFGAPADESPILPAEAFADAPVESLAITEQSIADRYGAIGDRIADLLRNADVSAAQILASAEDESAAVRAGAESDAAEIRAEAEAHASQLLAEAQSIRAEADTYRDEVMAELATARLEQEAALGEARAAAEAEVETFRVDSIAEITSLRSDAFVEIDELRAGANNEIAELRTVAHADAEAARESVLTEAAASIEANEVEAARLKEEAELDRAAARSELDDVRSEVSTLLEQARTQSEFIKQEADEIIRTKVRANFEQAQARIDVLRNTEVASRERIVLAQTELASALTRLDSEPAPELDPSDSPAVIEEAVARHEELTAPESVEFDAGADDAPSDDVFDVYETAEVDADIIDAAVVDTAPVETGDVDAHTENVVEGSLSTYFGPGASDDSETTGDILASAFGDPAQTADPQGLADDVATEPLFGGWPTTELTDVESVEYEAVGEAIPVDNVDTEAASFAPTEFETTEYVTTEFETTEFETTEYETTEVETTEYVTSEVDDDASAPTLGDFGATEHVVVESAEYGDLPVRGGSDLPVRGQAEVPEPEYPESFGAASLADALPADDAPELGGATQEDALARLVREAMQEAVDSARKND